MAQTLATKLQEITDTLALSQENVAWIVGATARSVSRWARHEAVPQRLSRQRLIELAYVAEAVGEVMRPSDANLWLITRTGSWPTTPRPSGFGMVISGQSLVSWTHSPTALLFERCRPLSLRNCSKRSIGWVSRRGVVSPSGTQLPVGTVSPGRALASTAADGIHPTSCRRSIPLSPGPLASPSFTGWPRVRVVGLLHSFPERCTIFRLPICRFST